MSDFETKMHQIRFRLEHDRPRSRWRSLQHSARPPNWIMGAYF